MELPLSSFILGPRLNAGDLRIAVTSQGEETAGPSWTLSG